MSEHRLSYDLAGVNPWPVILLYTLDGVISACMMAWLGTTEMNPWLPDSADALLIRKTMGAVVVTMLVGLLAALAHRIRARRPATAAGTLLVAATALYATVNLWNLLVAGTAYATRFTS